MTDPAGDRLGFLGALRALLAAVDPHRKGQLSWLTLLAILSGGADLAVVGSAMNFLLALAGDARAWVHPVGQAALLFAAAAFFANLVRLTYLRRSETFIAGITHELTVEVQRRVLAQPFAYHARHHSSETIAALEKAESLSFNLIRQWLQGAAALASGLGVLGLLASIAPLAAFAAFTGLGLLYIGIGRSASRRLAGNSAAMAGAYDERIRKVQEGLGAIRDLKIDHTERAQLEDFRKADARYAAARASTAFIAAAPRFMVEIGAVFLVAALAAIMSARGSASALAFVGGLGLGGMRVLPLLQSAYHSWAYLKSNRGMADDVMDLLGLPVPAEEVGVASPLPFDQSLVLEAIAFSYPERSTPAVEGISLEIPRGIRLALTGETGSGKSTLADLVMGLLWPDAGRILVDGAALAPGNIRAWQRNVAHVAQSIFLADASIAWNIAFSAVEAPIDMDRVRKAAASAGIAGFIDTLPEGFDTEVGERGVRLSGGQRQRIGIARALYKDAPLLVLDEATNALDEAMEEQVLSNLFADKERTIIVIAHRLSALKHCDKVVTLSGGRLA
ncbi:ABC transporter ATP-binding protein [Sphingomonas alba]|uniref:ABC transporter ATP-binding protein/permease n=1 Tax=Sphingomonas alba TaxID=2908208 RepID=A0ABT0RJA2_9SPHN|nr:ABC transporter ATP-binding protein [Sphingomonas alba]MCL6682697.1 ABC transporter ATP-binding protein/permease [Sphingomonas alba]